MSNEIVVYSAALCLDCQKLKAFMDANGIAYETRDIREQPEHAGELVKQVGKEAVPYVVIDGEWVRGYEPGKPFSDSFARGIFGL